MSFLGQPMSSIGFACTANRPKITQQTSIRRCYRYFLCHIARCLGKVITAQIKVTNKNGKINSFIIVQNCGNRNTRILSWNAQYSFYFMNQVQAIKIASNIYLLQSQLESNSIEEASGDFCQFQLSTIDKHDNTLQKIR